MDFGMQRGIATADRVVVARGKTFAVPHQDSAYRHLAYGRGVTSLGQG
jgi:hypothetical protein